MKRTILFILLFLTASNAVKINQLAFNPITVESNTKKYSPKILKIPFDVDLEEYEHHPAFSYTVNSSFGTSISSSLHIPAFYTEPGKDIIVDITINCNVYDIFTWELEYSFTEICTLIVPVVEGVCENESTFPWLTVGNGLKRNRVFKVLEAGQTLWVNYGLGEGVGSYDGNNWSHWDSSNGLINNSVADIMKFKDGILIWHYRTGANEFMGYYNGTSWHYIEQNELLNHLGNKKLVDSDIAWVEYSEGGLLRFDGSTVTNYDTSNGIPSMDQFYFLESDRSGGIWINYSYPTYTMSHFDGTSWNSFTQLDSIPTKDLSEYYYVFDSTGGFFAHNKQKNEIGYFNGTSWEYYTTCVDDFKINKYAYVKYLLSGGEGTAWVEFTGQYDFVKVPIVRVTKNSETIYTSLNGLLAEQYTSIYPDKSGRLWVTYYQKGIGHFDGKNWTNYTIPNDILSYDIEQFIINETNNAWVIYKNSNEISYFDGRQWIHFNSTNGLPDYHIFRIIPISNGEAWAIFEYALGMIKLPNAISTAIVETDIVKNSWKKPITICGNTIHIANCNKDKLEIKVMNMKGQIVYLKQLSSGIGNLNISIPERLTKGMYLASFTIGNSTVVKKFLKSF